MALDQQVSTKAEALAPRVERLKAGLYRVPSQTESGVWWTVVADRNGVLHCSCKASWYGIGCSHKSAVYLRKNQEAANRQPTVDLRRDVSSTHHACRPTTARTP
jgi:hypothetical protein